MLEKHAVAYRSLLYNIHFLTGRPRRARVGGVSIVKEFLAKPK